MSGPAQVVVLTTLDTKGGEAAFVASLLVQRGLRSCFMDVGVRSAPSCRSDIAREEVAAAAGFDLGSAGNLRRDETMRRMGEGAGRLLAEGFAAGRYHGVLALGGNQGTAIAGIAFQRLPLGVPKLVVSTVASGNLRPYFGHKDVAALFSVADLLGGPNRVSRPILEMATAAIAAMVAASTQPFARGNSPAVAVSAFGNTHAAVTAARSLLDERGYEVVAFHASGAGGSAMEELIDAGAFSGVLDLTTHELVGEVFGQDVYAPTRPGRLTAAARRGLPQIFAPGGLDYFCFGAAETIPTAYRKRAVHHHNPFNTNVRTNEAELWQLGEVVAARLGQAPPGSAAVLYPAKGWSEVGSPGGPLYDPEANQAFFESLRVRLSPAVELHVLDATINDRAFAERAVEVLERLRTQMSGSPAFAERPPRLAGLPQ